MKVITHIPRLICTMIMLITLLLCFCGFYPENGLISFGKWVDWEELITKISIIWTNSPAEIIIEKVSTENTHQSIVEIISNPVFEQGNRDWDYLGQVQFIPDTDKSFVRLGLFPSSNLIGENCLVQTLPSLESTHWVEVEYEIHQEETLSGFDRLALVVLLDDTIVFLEPVRSIEGSQTQSILFELPVSERSDRELKICAGNWGDREHSGWINIYRVSSLIALLDSSDSLLIRVPDRELSVSYQFDGQLVNINEHDQFQLPANQLADFGEIRVTTAVEKPFKLRYYKFQPLSLPAQTNIVSCVDHNQELIVSIDQDRYISNTVSYLLWEAGCSAQEDFFWLGPNQLLNQAKLTIFQLPVDLSLSHCVSSKRHCQLFVDLDLFPLQCGSNFSLFVKVCLPNGWCSSPINLNPTSCNLDLLYQAQFVNEE